MLVAKNQDILAKAITNKHGKVQFSDELMNGQYGHQPVQVSYITVDGEFAVLPLTNQCLALSEQPVVCAQTLTMLNTSMFSDSDVYRLGEELVLTDIVSDK